MVRCCNTLYIFVLFGQLGLFFSHITELTAAFRQSLSLLCVCVVCVRAVLVISVCVFSQGSHFQRDSHQPTEMSPHPDKNHLPAQPGEWSQLTTTFPSACVSCSLRCLCLSVSAQGEHFGTTEATEAFFAMTRLFQSNDVCVAVLNFHSHLL